jgi:hypothetical protein
LDGMKTNEVMYLLISGKRIRKLLLIVIGIEHLQEKQ